MLTSSSISSIPTPPPYPSPEVSEMLEHTREYKKLTKNLFLSIAEKEKKSFEQVEKEWNEKLDNLPDREKILSNLIQALNDGKLSDPVFSNAEIYPFYALAAVKDGRLSREKFATLMLIRLGNQYPGNLSFTTIFQNGQPSSYFDKMFKITLGFVNDSLTANASPKLKNTSFLNEEQITDFYKQMKEKHSVEQLFIVGNDRDPLRSDDEDLALSFKRRSISQDIAKGPGINIMSRFPAYRVPMRMIPTAGMMSAFLKAKFTIQATRLNFILGLGRKEGFLRNALAGESEFSLPFPGFPLPKTADKLEAPGTDFPYHDFYHAFMRSCIPSEHQFAMIFFMGLLDSLIEDPANSKAAPFLLEWQERLLDMEHPYYRPEIVALHNFKPYQQFWFSIHQSIFSTLTRLSFKKDSADYQINYMRFLESLSEWNQLFHSLSLPKKIFQLLLKTHTDWKEIFNLPLENLEEVSNLLAKQSKEMVREQIKRVFPYLRPSELNEIVNQFIGVFKESQFISIWASLYSEAAQQLKPDVSPTN